MKTRRVLVITELALAATLTNAPPLAAAPSNMAVSGSFPFAGTWEGKMDGFPEIDLKISEADERISGVAVLYFQVGSPVPLLTPHIEGKTLTFEIQRHKCQQCEELASNAKFRMELTGTNEARLQKLNDSEVDKNTGPTLRLLRRDESTLWHDPSQHQTQFIIVEYGIRLEVLDWGGTGQPLVLLAGSGNTAHVFDDFAPQLTSFCHVYGITRRGYGESSHPDSGYTQQRLADDVLQALNSLKLTRPVLVGHSMAGEELTTLGDQHSDRLAGLVYLDAAADPTDFPASSPAYMTLYQNRRSPWSAPVTDRPANHPLGPSLKRLR